MPLASYKPNPALLEPEPSFFLDKTWQQGPIPFAPQGHGLTELTDLLGQLQVAGQAFYKAQSLLYHKSHQGAPLQRNGHQATPAWIAELYDRGKPSWLVAHGRSPGLRRRLPALIRPDLIWTARGWQLTEWDSVPGGLGLTLYLQQRHGLRAAQDPLADFYKALTADPALPRFPQVVVAVSQECSTYRPEWDWIVKGWQALGVRALCVPAEDLRCEGQAVWVKQGCNLHKVDLLVRVFELFDHANIPAFRALLAAEAQGHVTCSPPMLHYQEEKLSLALLHHPQLQAYWAEQLGSALHRWLQQRVPPAWVMDWSHLPLPPLAHLWAPATAHGPIGSWEALGALGRHQRPWVIKISGFHPTAWGSRGITIGPRSSTQHWQAALGKTRMLSASCLHILQDYLPPKAYLYPQERMPMAQGELPITLPSWHSIRLSPYLTSDQALLGALTTLCPPDALYVHATPRAILVPAQINTAPAAK
jgi:hypothetical protein